MLAITRVARDEFFWLRSLKEKKSYGICYSIRVQQKSEQHWFQCSRMWNFYLSSHWIKALDFFLKNKHVLRHVCCLTWARCSCRRPSGAGHPGRGGTMRRNARGAAHLEENPIDNIQRQKIGRIQSTTMAASTAWCLWRRTSVVRPR